ncbi:unnamed protein product [Mytilus edulis]|uniref:Uncharacterized protein n=1 Tax=Mytilus edulis TaxID=6550 RepID=A0A8S3VL14_MYTED|nr:unnamed protein product [Mytilus edulis]
MSTSSDGIPTEMSEDENKTLHIHINRRIRQENMNASSDGTLTEMSEDENDKFDRNNETRYTLDLQGSCKEECGSDYIGGLTIKNKTLPRDMKQFPSVDERIRDSKLTHETNKEDKNTVDLKSIKVVVSDVATIVNITHEEASKQNLMSIAACSENVLETESMDYPIKKNPNHNSSYHTDSNDHFQTANANMTPNPQSLETSRSLKNTQHKPAEPHTQESQDMKPINERIDGYLKNTLTLDSSLTDRQQSHVESQPHENQNVNRHNFVINVEKSNDVSETTQNIDDNNQSSQSTRTITAAIFESQKDRTLIRTKLKQKKKTQMTT